MSKLVLLACMALVAAPALAQQDAHVHEAAPAASPPAPRDGAMAMCPMMGGHAAGGRSPQSQHGEPTPGAAAPMNKDGMGRGMCMAPPSAAAPPASKGHDHTDPAAPGQGTAEQQGADADQGGALGAAPGR